MLSAEGVNLLPREDRPFDFHCPGIPGDLNMHRTSCATKQRRGGPCATVRCKEGFALTGRTEPDKRTIIPRAPKGAPPLCVRCGTGKALAPSKRQQRGVTEQICSPCVIAERKAAEERKRKEEALKFPGYSPNRAECIASILFREAENGMAMEKPGSYRYRAWETAHAQALRIFQAYDRNVDKTKIYQFAERVVDVINAEVEKAAECK